jgi:sporulation protein YlmC with PRC-barrel domain
MYFKLKVLILYHNSKGDFMRIKDELFGKEVLDADIQIVGKVSDVVFDKVTFEITDIVLKKTGFSEQIKSSENMIPMELVKVIGDKILLKGEDDI